MPTLAEIYRYPIKSTRGELLSASAIDSQGLPFDRAWMVADETGRMLTGRTEPSLVQISARTHIDTLTLTAPSCEDCVIPLSFFNQPAAASVWKDEFPAFAGANVADAWLSTFLGKPVRLLYVGESSARRVRRRPDVTLSFADAYPLLLIGQGSLDELNRRIGRTLSMRRFRPNLVVSGAEPFAEDHWKKIRIGNVIFSIEKPCERCVFTTVDPENGEKSSDQEPLRTLATFRRTPEGVLFGQNAVAEHAGEIAFGMDIEILEMV
ncbi:MAG: MOSC domain-containing protein [Formivibrio sp.]|nr:MOSC domain-containing protein [Formivibrio sp.]